MSNEKLHEYHHLRRDLETPEIDHPHDLEYLLRVTEVREEIAVLPKQSSTSILRKCGDTLMMGAAVVMILGLYTLAGMGALGDWIQQLTKPHENEA